MFEEAEKIAEKGPDDALKIRLLFNIAHRTADENKLMTFHQKLKDKKEDQLSLAAVHYLRSHHQEALLYTLHSRCTNHFLDTLKGDGHLQATVVGKQRRPGSERLRGDVLL